MKVTLKGARVSAGYTLDEAAKIAGVSRPTMTGYEKNPANAPLWRLQELARYYGLEIENIHLGDEKEFQDSIRRPLPAKKEKKEGTTK